MKRLTLPLLLTVLFIIGFASPGEIKPGVDRWKIKTSILPKSAKHTIAIADLLTLDNALDKDTGAFDKKRIPNTVNNGQLKEGNIITTTGYLHLVALENDSKTHRDGDYHIQITNNKKWGNGCLIVEIPDPQFITNQKLKDKCAAARQFVRDSLLKGKEPSPTGNTMQHEVYVTVTGQLFFDLTHVSNNNRGKSNNKGEPMSSANVWELHPVTDIRFAPKPK